MSDVSPSVAMTPPFTLDSRLAADTAAVTDLRLSAVRLMNEGAVEIVDLSPEDRAQLMEEIAQVSGVLRALTHCDKLNVAALGNMVPQLHVHVIGRFSGDPAWPGPVWGKAAAQPYGEAPREGFIAALRARLSAG
jgi:diadenosine tetraphosphate (Ap4A) HIT family hydrolase